MAANQSGNKASSHSRGVNGTLIGAIFLGICILVAGFNIGGNLKKLNKTMGETVFADTNNLTTPSELTVADKKYLTESEAAAYLNLSAQKITDLINSGEITEYVKTDSGYSISVSVLDAWFDNEAYQNKLNSKNTNSNNEAAEQ